LDREAPEPVTEGRDLVLILNPHAGGGRARSLLPEIERALAARGLSHRVVLTESLEHGRDTALAAAAGGELPVVVSGDGLIGQVGGALAGRDAVMGVIPGGRGNDFARVAGIPTDVGAAVDALAAGHERSIDVGEIDGKRFLCIASCGFDSDANRIANEARIVRGNFVYAYAALRALASWRPATFRLELNGQVREVRGYSVAAANGAAYGGGMYAAPGARLDDGLLDVVACAKMGKLRFLFRLMPKSFKGTHVNEPEVTVERAAEVRISADRPFVVFADGDPIATLPVTVRLLPRALRVLVAASE
jgi:YegS/Rv2252/BmrU family lipid kinase